MQTAGMRWLMDAGFVLWSAMNMGAAWGVGFFAYALLGLRYDEMHTVNTSFDPDPSLTRGTVVWNIVGMSGQSMEWLAVLVAWVWAVNFAIYRDELEKYRRAGFCVSLACSGLLLWGVVGAGIDCLRRYP